MKFLILLSVFFLQSLSGLMAQDNLPIKPIAQKGLIDLRNWNFARDGLISLDGDWTFFYQDFLTAENLDNLPSKKYLAVPSASWADTKWQGKSITGQGYATYYLRILLPKGYRNLAFKTLDQSSAYKIYVNNHLLGKVGKIGKTPETTIPKSNVGLFVFEANTNILDVVIHIANFSHRKGGLWNSITLGTEEQVFQSHEQSIAIIVFLCGSLLIMSIYHFLLYFIRRQKDASMFFFSLLCLVVSLRILVTGENYLLTFFPDLSWEWKHKLEYLSSFLIVPFIYSYLKNLFPQEYSKYIVFVIYGFIGSLTLLTLLLPTNIFSYFIFPYYTFLIFVLGAIFYGLSKALLHQREGALIFLLGSIFLAISIVNDMLYSAVIINTFYMVHFGFLVFFFSQASLIAIRFSKAFNQVAILTSELKDANQNLEQRVQASTEELREANEELSSRQEELNQTVSSLNEVLNLANQQKAEIEEINKDITASIAAAKRIQDAMLPRISEIQSVFPESFILFKPLQIVSGDFYWFSKQTHRAVLVAADCTGHGIPGAFMSLIGNDVLNDVVNIQQITEPDRILNELRTGIKKILRQEETKNTDGMDVAVCTVDFEQNILEYAGSYNPFVYVQNNEIKIIKADKIIVGGFNNYVEQASGFTKHSISLDTPTSFYIFSDGFQDQFGGERKKKFMPSRFYELLFSVHHLSAFEQQQILEKVFDDWRAESSQVQPQVDDLLIIGVKI